jgi:hypothetical protein
VKAFEPPSQRVTRSFEVEVGSYIAIDGQPANSSWYQALFGKDGQIFIPLNDNPLTRGQVYNLQCNHILVRVAQDL